MSDEALVELVLCTLREGAPSSDEELAALGRRHGLDDASIAALLAVGARRLGLHRRLLEQRLDAVLETMTPSLRAALPGGTGALVRAFLAEGGGPRSPFVRDLPREVLTFAGASLATRFGGPAHLRALAERELTEFEVMAADDDEPAVALDLELDRGVCLTRSLRVVRLDHATHRADAPPFEQGAFAVAVFRDDEGDLCHLELEPAVADVLEALARGEALGAAVTGVAYAHGLALGEAIERVAPALEELRRAGAVRGPAERR